MGNGKRYDSGKKLNIKKVVATMLAFVVLVMAVVVFVKWIRGAGSAQERKVAISYYSVYTEGKWGVIDSKGEYILKPTYDSMVIVPDNNEKVFICQEQDLDNGTFKSYVIDEKGTKKFTDYENVEVMQNVDKLNQIFYDKNILKVTKDGKYGLINYKGKELLKCEYQSIEPLKYVSNSFVITKDDKKGLVDASGSEIIEPKYLDIESLTYRYEDGYIVKNESGKYGLFNYNKQSVLECKYDKIMNLTGSGMYVVVEDGTKKVVAIQGTEILTEGFDEVISIDNKNIIYKKDGKYGVKSSENDNETKIEAKYDDLKYVFDNNYIAKENGKYGITNFEGNTKVEFKYTNIVYLKDEGIIEADREDGKTDLLDANFEVKTSGIVSEVNNKNGFIKVRVEDEYKYYNYRLEEKAVSEVYPANTLFLSKKDGKYGFVNKNGVVVVNYNYDDATEQNSYGYAAVKKDGKWGVIDSTGKVIVEPKYELKNNIIIDFIKNWHLAVDWDANYYTDIVE